MSDSWAIVGDVHGDAARLQQIVGSPALANRRLVLVGDYVNRGPSTREVLDILCEERSRRGEALILLAGNHEYALLDYLQSGDLVRFARHGGIATIRSYVGRAHGDVRAQLAASMPSSHLRLLREGLEVYVETADMLISHSGYDPQSPHDRSARCMTGSHPEIFEASRTNAPRPLIICGHYVQVDQRPVSNVDLICLDTGCGTTGGPLTAVLLPERQFVSA